MRVQHSHITLDQLMASVETDLNRFADNGMINRGSVIKVIRKVNEYLGLKINRERQIVLEIKNYKADLPSDLQAIQVALLLGVQSIQFHKPGEVYGNHTTEWNRGEELPVEIGYRRGACNNCGEEYWITQRFEDRIVQYDRVVPLRINFHSRAWGSSGILNFRAKQEIEIEDGYIICPIKEGHLYLNYLADMADEDGNLLILDHPLLTEYYEYSVKKHLLENWMLNTDADVAQKLMYVKAELRSAESRAKSFVNTIEFSEIKRSFDATRKAFYNKFIGIFE